MDQKTIDKWEKDTPKNLPEKATKTASYDTPTAYDYSNHVINMSTGLSSTDDQNENNIKVPVDGLQGTIGVYDTPHFTNGFLKAAGGPGSGVPFDNTDPISFLESSPLISIGYRQKFLEEHFPIEKNVEIPTNKIKYKGQEKMVPKKLVNIMIKWKEVADIPIDVIIDKDRNYHIIDGHHRALAAILRREKTVRANVYQAPGE